MTSPAPEPAPVSAHGRRDRAIFSRAAWAFLLVTTVLALAVDLWTKDAAFRTVAGTPVVIDRADVLAITAQQGPKHIKALIPRHEPVQVIPHLLDFTLVLNPGAVFGIGPGKRWFFITFTAMAMLAGLAMFALGTRRRDHTAHIALGLLLAGGLGNFYDRLVFGCVRDFIHPLPGVKYPFGISTPWSGTDLWPYVSNVADLWLIIGIAVLVVLLWRADRRHVAASRASTAPTPSAASAPSEPAP